MRIPVKNPKPSLPTAFWWLAIGISIGTALGVAFDNIGLWLALGVAIGAVGGFANSKRNDSD